MRAKPTSLILSAFILLLVASFAHADDGTAWTHGLDYGASLFEDGESNYGVSLSGSISRKPSGFIKKTVTAVSRTTSRLGATIALPTVGTTRYALEVPGFFVLSQPTLSVENQLTYGVATGQCPTADYNAIFVFAHWDPGGGNDVTRDNQAAFGTFTWHNSASNGTVSAIYNVTRAEVVPSFRSLTVSGACSGGTTPISGPGDRGGTLYMSAAGGGFFRTNASKGILMIPQTTITQSGLDGTYSVFRYKGRAIGDGGGAIEDRKIMRVTISSFGTSGVATEVADPDTNTLGSFQETLAIDRVNYPGDGMLTGTLTQNGLIGKVACAVHIAGKKVLFCAGQSPDANSIPLNYILVSDDSVLVGIGISQSTNTATGTTQLTARGYYSDGTSADISNSVTWSSDNTAVGSVDSAGVATVIGRGAASFTATLGGVEATIEFTGAPGSFSIAAATAGIERVSLAWGDSGGATRYHIRRGTTSGTYPTTVSTDASSGYVDSGLVAGTSYFYLVVALSSEGITFSNNEVSAVPLGQPSSGNVIYFAGGDRGDNVAATAATLYSPKSVALDSLGNLYIADTANNKIRMVPITAGTYFGQNMVARSIYTIAGTGLPGATGDGGVATSAKLNNPESISLDSSGNVYIADTGNHKIRILAAGSGTRFGQSMAANSIYTIAGTGVSGVTGDSGAATSAKLNSPGGLRLDSLGNVFFTARSNHKIRMVAATTGTRFGQSVTANNIYTIVGTGTSGSTGDGAAATLAKLNSPDALSFDGSGNLYIADSSNYKIRMVASATGTRFGQSMTANNIYTIAGTGVSGSTGDGGAATSATLKSSRGVDVDSAGNLYIADTGSRKIRMVASVTGTRFGQSMTANRIYTIAGTGEVELRGEGEGGVATAARLSSSLEELCVDSGGNVYLADSNSDGIRIVPAATGNYFGRSMTGNSIYTIVGKARLDTSPQGAIPALANFRALDVSVDSSGNVYIADGFNYKVRMVPAITGTYFGQSMTANRMYTIAGTGVRDSTGDGGLGTSASLIYPIGVTVDSASNVYIVDYDDHKIRMVASTTNATTGPYLGRNRTAGYIYRIAGTGVAAGTGDGGLATSATLSSPDSVSVDASGNLYIADFMNRKIRMVAAATSATTGPYFGRSRTANRIYTIVGTGTAGATGDGGLATAATLDHARGVSVDASGNVYIADLFDSKIRMAAAITGTRFGQSVTAGRIYTIAGPGVSGVSGDGGPALSANFFGCSSVTVDASGNLYIQDSGNGKVRMVPASTGTYFGQSMTANFIYTIAGSGISAASAFGILNAPFELGTAVAFGTSSGMSLGPSGDIFFSGFPRNVVYKLIR